MGPSIHRVYEFMGCKTSVDSERAASVGPSIHRVYVFMGCKTSVDSV